MPLAIPLPILIGIITVGFVVLFILLTAMGKHSRATLTEQSARDRLRLDFPDRDLQSIALSDDQQVALAPVAGSHEVALVAVVGDKLSTRMLAPPAIRRVSADAHGLWLRLRDPAFPRVHIRVADPEQRGRWQAQLSADPTIGGGHGRP